MKKLFISVLFLFSFSYFYSQGGVAINNTGVNPNPNTMLDVSSDTKGILITRITTAARTTLGTALGLTDNGMLVYDKDLLAFYYWNGTIWVQVGSGTGDNWGTQVVQTSGVNVSGDGTTGNPLVVTDADSDPTNEIEIPTGGTAGQVLSTDGSGTYTWVTDGTGTDVQNIQNLAFNNTTNILTVGIQNGTSQTVDLTSLLTEIDGSITNEIQDLAINTTTNILTITNNGTPTSIDLTPYLDNTDSQNIMGSSFNATTGDLVIGIQNGTNQTLNFNGLKDHDWYKVGTTTAPTTINDNIFTQGNVGIGVTVPVTQLDIIGTTRLTSRLYFRDVSAPFTDEHFSISHSFNELTFQPVNGNFIAGGGDLVHFVKNGANIGQVIFGNTSTNDYTAYFDLMTNNVGINTLGAPTEKLEVQGSVKIVDGTQGAGKVLTSDANGKASWKTPAGGFRQVYTLPATTVTYPNSVNSVMNFPVISTPFTGFYLINFKSFFTIPISGHHSYYISIYVNGVLYSSTETYATVPAGSYMNVTDVYTLNANAGDVIQLKIRPLSGGANFLVNSTLASRVKFDLLYLGN